MAPKDLRAESILRLSVRKVLFFPFKSSNTILEPVGGSWLKRKIVNLVLSLSGLVES